MGKIVEKDPSVKRSLIKGNWKIGVMIAGIAALIISVSWLYLTDVRDDRLESERKAIKALGYADVMISSQRGLLASNDAVNEFIAKDADGCPVVIVVRKVNQLQIDVERSSAAANARCRPNKSS